MNSKTSLDLETLHSQVHDFYDIHKGLNLLKNGLPKTLQNPTLSIDGINSIAFNDRDLPLIPTGVAAPKGQTSLNALATSFNWGKYSSPRFMNAFHTDAEIPSLFISVHAQQTKPHQYLTQPFSLKWNQARSRFADSIVDNLLVDERFAETPRLFLFSTEFKIPNSRYLSHATALFHSVAGEIDISFPRAREYHIAGEQFQQCLATTVQTIINRDLIKTSNKKSTVYIYAEHTLATNGDGINADSITELFPLTNLMNGDDAESLINRHLLPTSASLSPYTTKNQDLFTKEFNHQENSFTIQNNSNGSSVTIVII